MGNDDSARSAATGERDALLTIERVAVLRSADMFRSAPGHALVAAARVMTEVRFAPDDVVIERGADEDWLYVVASGRVRAHIGDRTLVERGPGGVIGELTVLAPGPRSATVTALEHSLLLRLDRRPMEELIEDSGEIARAVIGWLALRLQQLADDDAAEHGHADGGTDDD